MTEYEQKPTTDQAPEQDLALTHCLADRDAWKEKYLRVQADFDNFTKRIEKERITWKQLAQSAVVTDLLAVVDDIDRALEAQLPSDLPPAVQQWLAGFTMIRKSLLKFFEKYEIVEIVPTMPFNPEYHEAIMQVAAPDKKPGEVVAILQKGYLFKGHVLRPAKVSVAQ